MGEVFTVVSVICASSLICTLVSAFVTDGSTKKIINLVLGAFVICSLIIPVKNALSSFDINISQYESPESVTSTDDEAYSKAILNLTKQNLESTVRDLMLQNNIEIDDCEIILAQTDENSIIISSLSIYISKEYVQYTDLISQIAEDNFGVLPSVMTE